MVDLERVYDKQVSSLYDRMSKARSVSPFGCENLRVLGQLPVHIDRDGSFVWTVDGNHRLYIALILGLECLPVRANFRHLSWQLKLLGHRIKGYVSWRRSSDASKNQAVDHPDDPRYRGQCLARPGGLEKLEENAKG